MRWAWRTGKLQGEMVYPVGRRAGDYSMKRILNEDVHKYLISSTPTMDTIMDPTDGSVRYVGRSSPEDQAYEDILRRARNEFELGNYQSAYLLAVDAEMVNPLRKDHRLLAARALGGCLQRLDISDLSRAEMMREGVRRWTEITTLGPGERSSECWAHRGVFEFLSGDIDAAIASCRQAELLGSSSSTAGGLRELLKCNRASGGEAASQVGRRK